MTKLKHFVWALLLVLVAVGPAMGQPPIPEQTRAMLERTLGAKGTYISEESAFRFTFPRSDVALRIGNQRVSPLQAPQSWVTFSPSLRSESMMNGELVLLDDEVNSVISVALRGVQVTALGTRLRLEEPRLSTLSITASGSYQTIGAAVRVILDEIRRIRSSKPASEAAKAVIATPVASAIEAAPLNAILSMQGASTDGVYRAAIGRVSILNDTPMARELGIRTSLTIFGATDHAFLDAEIATSADELQRVLQALTTKGLNVVSIGNHWVSEHPQIVYVRTFGQGRAADLARSVRFVLEAQLGGARGPSDRGL